MELACHKSRTTNANDNIHHGFKTGHRMQIPRAFPTLWRMLMSRIQNLRTRLPVHIDLVHGHGPKKPGQ